MKNYVVTLEGTFRTLSKILAEIHHNADQVTTRGNQVILICQDKKHANRLISLIKTVCKELENLDQKMIYHMKQFNTLYWREFKASIEIHLGKPKNA